MEEKIKITIEKEGFKAETYEVEEDRMYSVKNAIMGLHTTETMKSIVDTFGTMNKKTIVYDVNELPTELKIADCKLTISDIIAIYKETGFILVDSKGKGIVSTRVGF